MSAYVLDDIVAKLAAIGLGAAGTDIKTGAMPETPHVTCSVDEFQGEPPEYGFGSAGVRFETPGVQVLFRGEPHDYDGPRGRAQLAYVELPKVEATTLNGTFYHWIHPVGPPRKLKTDGKGRVYVVLNLHCKREL